jgi:hypothetical protein
MQSLAVDDDCHGLQLFCRAWFSECHGLQLLCPVPFSARLADLRLYRWATIGATRKTCIP